MLAPVLPLALLLACACTESSENGAEQPPERRDTRSLSGSAAVSCQYEGRLFAAGAAVGARDTCLRCRCARGALACRRRACPAPPDPPPPRCRLAHRAGACCPELLCHNDATDVGRSGLAAADVYPEQRPATHVLPVCAEGGAAYAAGSAMSSATACEQCFCLGGARRCVRPRCLPAPRGCRARPAPGACCPPSFECDREADGTDPPDEFRVHDCKVAGEWVTEGERVRRPAGAGSCTQCFCLRGQVRCQALACAPPLMGCRPLIEPGQCCPHQYHCDHQTRRGMPRFHLQQMLDNALASGLEQERSSRSAPSGAASDTAAAPSGAVTGETTPSLAAEEGELIATAKVKRRTGGPALAPRDEPAGNVSAARTTPGPTDAASASAAAEAAEAADAAAGQPEGSVKVIINGTINCTAELSSATLAVNATRPDAAPERAQPRAPAASTRLGAHTHAPGDIITDSSYSEDFEDESYAINVTSSLVSSLRANGTRPATAAAQAAPSAASFAHDVSMKTIEEYEPTLPASLPNLKIIPFVAADAVVEEALPPRDGPADAALVGEHERPVYYPGVAAQGAPAATRRADLYGATQYPMFLPEAAGPPRRPPPAHELDLADEHHGGGDVIASLLSYAVAAPPDYTAHVNKAPTGSPDRSTKFELVTPAVNLFSPPMETEGGFIPKGPGIDGFYPPYPSTPAGALVPDLTTSLQLDTARDCVAGGGRRVLEGESIGLACSICSCAWGDLHCTQRPCPTPPGCRRRPAAVSSADACCGDLVCDQGERTTPPPSSTPTSGAQAASSRTERPRGDLAASSTESSSLTNRTKSPTAATPHPKVNVDRPTIRNSGTTPTELTSGKTGATSTEASLSDELATAQEELESAHSGQQDDEEDDEDSGFSFGSVLKLLLSDAYETTTAQPAGPAPAAGGHAPAPPPTRAAHANGPPYAAAVRKQQAQNTMNRIDHLILGEATAVKAAAPRPATPPYEPAATRKPAPVSLTNAIRTPAPPAPPEASAKGGHGQTPARLAAGLLKLAGCNIYGQMYRVGGKIAELSTPCQECRCTELGVQCARLGC